MHKFVALALSNRFVIPESPRWLVVNGKYEDVLKLLQKICRINNRCLPEDFQPTCLLVEVSVNSNSLCGIRYACTYF